MAMSMSSHVIMAPSLLFSSSSWERSYSCSSSTAFNITAMSGVGENLHTPTSYDKHQSRSKPKQLPVLTGAQAAHLQGLVGANRHPHPVRRWRLATVAGVPAPRAHAMVIAPSHHEQGNRASFKMKGKEGRCHSNSLKIESTR
jgi:hypothetical protein